MKGTHIRKILARHERVVSKFSDEARVRRMLFRTVPHILARDASNRANDLIRLLDYVPALIEDIYELRAERARLSRELRELRAQVDNTIIEEDGVEVEREPGIGDVLQAMGYLD